MHTIYRIVCFRNGKVYVGQSCDPWNRKNHHFSDLRLGKHTNKYLQRAFDKYGLNAFYFEIIESEISNENADEREQYWIRHFDSYRRGYNGDLGGQRNRIMEGKKCTWNGIEYPSVAFAAIANGVKKVTMRQRILRGQTCDAQVIKYGDLTSKPCEWNGISYRSIHEASRALGISHTTLIERFERGHSCDGDLKRNR